MNHFLKPLLLSLACAAMLHAPARGYSTNTASRKALPLLENKVSDTCFTEL